MWRVIFSYVFYLNSLYWTSLFACKLIYLSSKIIFLNKQIFFCSQFECNNGIKLVIKTLKRFMQIHSAFTLYFNIRVFSKCLDLSKKFAGYLVTTSTHSSNCLTSLEFFKTWFKFYYVRYNLLVTILSSCNVAY